MKRAYPNAQEQEHSVVMLKDKLLAILDDVEGPGKYTVDMYYVDTANITITPIEEEFPPDDVAKLRRVISATFLQEDSDAEGWARRFNVGNGSYYWQAAIVTTLPAVEKRISLFFEILFTAKPANCTVEKVVETIKRTRYVSDCKEPNGTGGSDE